MTKDVRPEILRAMDRLLAGSPLRSDGKLTAKSLAVEAGVPRHFLTQVHTDLKEMFYARVRNESRLAPETEAALARLAEAQKEAADWERRALDAEAEFEALVRAMQVVALTKPVEPPRLSIVRDSDD